MAGQRRDHQHARLRRVDVLGEMQRLPNGSSSVTSGVTGTSRLPTLTVAMAKSGRVWVSSKREIISRRGRELLADAFAQPPEGRSGRRHHGPREERNGATRSSCIW